MCNEDDLFPLRCHYLRNVHSLVERHKFVAVVSARAAPEIGCSSTKYILFTVEPFDRKTTPRYFRIVLRERERKKNSAAVLNCRKRD